MAAKAAVNSARPIDPRITRRIGLVKLRGMQTTDAVSIVYRALLNLRQHLTRKNGDLSPSVYPALR
jgi:hypothetical protein